MLDWFRPGIHYVEINCKNAMMGSEYLPDYVLSRKKDPQHQLLLKDVHKDKDDMESAKAILDMACSK
jgi:hypothetical protein